jgi:hypothetical protein
MMERHAQTAYPSKRRHSYPSIARGIPLLIACFAFAVVVEAQDAKPQQRAADRSVRVSIHNVKYRFAENVSVQINDLSGALVPVGDHEMPVFDDKESFNVRIDSAEVAISPQDVANLMNQFVFARTGSQVAGISVATTPKGHLKIKGRLKDKGNIPFETEGVLVPANDGKLRLHTQNMRALKIPVNGLMDAFGIEIDNLIKSGKVPGVAADGNDLIFDLEQMLPTPHIEGKVTNVRVEPTTIVQTFAADAKRTNYAKPIAKYRGNYVALQGNKVQFGKLTMDDCDIVLQDVDPADSLDFFLDRYKEQLAAGYTKISTSFQVRAYIKDFGKLAPSKNSTTPAKTPPTKN